MTSLNISRTVPPSELMMSVIGSPGAALHSVNILTTNCCTPGPLMCSRYRVRAVSGGSRLKNAVGSVIWGRGVAALRFFGGIAPTDLCDAHDRRDARRRRGA